MRKTILAIIVALCLWVSPSPTVAVGKISKNERQLLPTTIKSNQMLTDNKGKTAVFSGDVVTRQGDITIYSDRMTINYGDKGDVEKVEADGNVRIVQENRIGTSTHAVYDSRNGLITLTGSPKVMQGSDSISGKTIIYYVDEDKSVVSGDTDSRVNAVIHPPAK